MKRLLAALIRRPQAQAIACALFVALTALPAYAQTCLPPPAGLVSWWPGDGDANDIIGGNNGTLVGGVTYGTVLQGNVSQAFSFSGSGLVSLASAPTSNDFTIDAWVYPRQISSPNGYRTIYADNTRGLWLKNGRISWWSPSTDRFIGNSPLAINAWTHIALTYSNGVFRGYRNGVLDGSSNSSGEFLPAQTGIGIGGHSNYPPEHFDGLIDEVEIFKRALSQSEIQAIYAAGKAGKCKPLPADAKGMTWRWGGVNATNGTVTVGCGASDPVHPCNASVGDQLCTDSLPLLCFKPFNPLLPVPKSVVETPYYYQWSGGIVATTPPVQASSFGGSLALANARCEQEFGPTVGLPKWRVAEFHDGGRGVQAAGGWNFHAYGNVSEPKTRFWVHINDQPKGTCFPKP